ncbi:MAG: DUF2199 domain-containing protein [Hyphomicrobiales bacterium]|nr:DUF2199 domain-containing protein [Hyphomicrobiales bacterium]
MTDNQPWTCSVCSKSHTGFPAITFDAPAHFHALSDAERASKAERNADFCVIQPSSFYVRCVLIVPIHGSEESLEWGVWSSLSEENFQKYSATFFDDDQSKIGPMFGWFSSSLPIYEDTLNLRCRVVPRNQRRRPHIHFDPSPPHQLVRDAADGISLERAIEFASLIMHRH